MNKTITLTIAVDKKYLKNYGEKKYCVFYENHLLFHFVNRFKGKWLFWSRSGGEFARPFAIVESQSVPMEQIRNLGHAFATIALGGEAIDEIIINGERITINKKAEDYPQQTIA